MADIVNRQARIWICTLYPDNESHLKAINMAKSMRNTILMLHDRTPGDKPHYHCVFVYENPYYIFTLISKLNLNLDVDYHLFRTLKQEDFSRLDKYVLYLTHENTKKPDKYRYDCFEGGLKSYAFKICDKYDLGKEAQLNEICFYIDDGFKNGYFDPNSMTLAGAYMILYEKFGSPVFNKWPSVLKDMVKDIMYRYR